MSLIVIPILTIGITLQKRLSFRCEAPYERTLSFIHKAKASDCNVSIYHYAHSPDQCSLNERRVSPAAIYAYSPICNSSSPAFIVFVSARVVLCDFGVELLLLFGREERSNLRARILAHGVVARAHLCAQLAILFARLV